MKKREIRELSKEVYVSYVAAAPDHGRPETAVFHTGGRTRTLQGSAVLAVGEEARRVFETVPLEEALEALRRPEEEIAIRERLGVKP